MRRALPVIVASAIGVALLVALGVWQLQRLQWKEAILARIAARQSAAVTSVPPEAGWPSLEPDDYEYRHVAVVGTYATAESALVFRGGSSNAPGEGPGYLLLTPLRLPDGATVIVNRGFAPLASAEEARANVPHDSVSVTGLMRSPEARNAFTPADEPTRDVWFTRDPSSIAAHLALARVAPFTIDADADPTMRGWPRGGATPINIPNNHLSYALTWFGLAAALIGVTAAYLRSTRTVEAQ